MLTVKRCKSNQDWPKLTRNDTQFINDVLTATLHGNTIVRDGQCKHDQWQNLRSVSLGWSNSNFWSGIDVNSTMSLTTNWRTDRVRDADQKCSTRLAITKQTLNNKNYRKRFTAMHSKCRQSLRSDWWKSRRRHGKLESHDRENRWPVPKWQAAR